MLRDEPVTLEDNCLIMYTSGTTGRPKGAVLTHGNMTWSCLNQILGFDFTPDERTLGLAPLFHIGGLNGTLNPTLLRGGCVVLVRGFDPPATLAVIAEQRVTSFFAVPTMLDALSRQPDFGTLDLTALRTIGAAGAPLPLPLLHTWLERGITVQQAYGMTESAPAGTALDSADAVAKVGSAGKSQFFVDVRVVRPDGTECGPDEIGEVVLSGPNIMAGYWNAPDATEAAIVDGWYHSGDAGSTDADGYLYIRDRYKDMIISGGENVYPAEIESALLELPDVARGRRHRDPRREVGRGRDGRRRPGSRSPARPGGDPRRPPRAAGRLQGAAPRGVRDRTPQDRHRKDPQARSAHPLRPDRGDSRMSTTTTIWPSCPR